eukprot:TRINITY_DN16981_c0_g1_i1.p1 TRINITY_DN16981_c0_g1~~TRINITY_DN16981_c0_g1_i1.p1  ORF type:complete len:180 (-),score=31.15 TRINITY_DN16981_c0_g1_i1:71-589(-)
MGNFFKKKQNTERIALLGLKNSGKTTIINQLKYGEIPKEINQIPRIGFKVETINFKNIQYAVWDISSEISKRMYKKIFHAIIFVVDSHSNTSLGDAKLELKNILSAPELKNAKVLILANKQDLVNSYSINQISKALDLENIPQQWKIQGTCALNARGIEDGMDWITSFKRKV